MTIPPATWRILRAAAYGAICGGLVLLAGCLVIPTNYHAAGSRRNVSPETSQTLQAGVTTRKEVLLTLGEPDYASEDGRRLGYAWTKVKALLLIASYGGGGEIEIKRSYVLGIDFDDTGRMSQLQLLKEWGPKVSPAQEMKAAAGDRPNSLAESNKVFFPMHRK